MGSYTLVLVTVLTAFAVGVSAGRIYRIVRAPSPYDIWRQKRQSHPLATQVRIPEVAFADTVSLTNPPPPSGVGGGAGQQDSPGLLEIADYLTPPPPAGGLVATGRQQQGDKWDLGYDANDILVPPADQARQYDTLKLFSLIPNSSGPLAGDPALENTIQDVLQLQDNAPAGTGSHEVPIPRQRDHEHRQSEPLEQGPVYTYVKTDKHGHFKWGVRHGH